MTLCDAITKACSKKMQVANLYDPLKKAKENPELGIKIINKSARFVIRDAAMIAFDFLPLHCFCGNREEVVERLSGSVTRKQLEEFLAGCPSSVGMSLLLEKMLECAGTDASPDDGEGGGAGGNIYGSYGYAEQPQAAATSPMDALCRLFKVVK